MTESVSELKSYVSDLEYRLQEYHEWLEQAIADRDRLALDAAWGVHASLSVTMAYAVVLAAAIGWGKDRWWAWLIAVVAAPVVATIVNGWSNRHRMKEVERLAKLPEWEWKDPTW
jgi:hypothetical protein